MTLRTTQAPCPVCRQRLPARYVSRGEGVYLEKTCPRHGDFSVEVFRGEEAFLSWCRDWESVPEGGSDCPRDCGLCARHRNRTCCAVLDVTTRCNLRCPVCFADSGPGSDREDVFSALEEMYEKGVRFLHLSGGEPTVREDLPEIVRYAAGLGYEYLQLNTNGLRLSQEAGYAEKLSEAGLSAVFLQFDGTEDGIYRAIRGRPLLEVKKAAIDRCDRAELGVVLVPTLIPGVNDRNIGAIVSFALERMPAVRGIHFQPVMYAGRFPEGKRPRMTISDLLSALETQTGGLLKAADFLPSACDAPLCGLHGEFRTIDGVLTRLPGRNGACCSPGRSPGRNQRHVKNRWTRMRKGQYEPGSMDAFLQELSDSTFSVSAMLFQDLETLDYARLMDCSIHVYEKGRLIPFCAYHNFPREERSHGE